MLKLGVKVFIRWQILEVHVCYICCASQALKNSRHNEEQLREKLSSFL